MSGNNLGKRRYWGIRLVHSLCCKYNIPLCDFHIYDYSYYESGDYVYGMYYNGRIDIFHYCGGVVISIREFINTIVHEFAHYYLNYVEGNMGHDFRFYMFKLHVEMEINRK